MKHTNSIMMQEEEVHWSLEELNDI